MPLGYPGWPEAGRLPPRAGIVAPARAFRILRSADRPSASRDGAGPAYGLALTAQQEPAHSHEANPDPVAERRPLAQECGGEKR